MGAETGIHGRVSGESYVDRFHDDIRNVYELGAACSSEYAHLLDVRAATRDIPIRAHCNGMPYTQN